jgi:mRNA interferase MazF
VSGHQQRLCGCVRDRAGQGDFESGSLQRTSYARPGKLFTAHDSLVVKTAGVLRAEARNRVVDRVIEVLRNG